MKHILMINHELKDAEGAGKFLRRKYRLSEVASGQEARELLLHSRPDVILMDSRLPDMDGYKLLKILKEDETKADIPVIILSADPDMQSEVKALKLGAADYVKTPYEPEILLNRISKIIHAAEINKTLEILANEDSLTSLWNRRYMEEYIEKGNSRQNVGVFMLLDMDNFKRVNDNFGHLMGDEVLVAFARTLKECAGTENRVCRLGGDEFVVFLGADYSEQEIRDIARNLIVTIEYETNRVLDFDKDSHISVSIGIALKPADGKTFQTLYNNADKALYFVKRNGKRGYHFYGEANDSVQVMQAENNQIDLMHLKMLIRETDGESGAYKVEYSGFKRIYRFVARCVERSKQDVQIVLFSVSSPADPSKAGGNEELTMKLDHCMQKLEEAVAGSLRRGDVATKFSTSQYILMDATLENGEKVVSRIMDKYHKDNSYPDYEISYDIQSINGNGNKKADIAR